MASPWKALPWDTGDSFGGVPTTPQFGLAQQANAFMSGQAAMPYRMNLPGYDAMARGESGNILDMIGGEVPDDVVDQIIQGAAERGIMTGSPGGPNSNAAYLRALGLTSLGLQKEGAERFTQAVARTPVPEIWNPLSLYVPQVLGGMELAAAKAGTRTGGGGGGGGGGFYTGGQTTTPYPLGAEGLAFNKNYNEGVSPVGRVGWFADENPAPSWMDTYGVTSTGRPSSQGTTYMGEMDMFPADWLGI